MTIQPNSFTLKKLGTMKRLFLHAVEQSKKSNDMSKLVAIILFDLTNETILKLALKEINKNQKPNSELDELIKQLGIALGTINLGNVPFDGHLRRVRSIRNAAQHEARTPNTTELSESYIYTRDFAQDFIRQVWDIEFDKISITDLVSNAEVRKLLVKAESRLSLGEYEESAADSFASLIWSLNHVKRTLSPFPYRRSLFQYQLSHHSSTSFMGSIGKDRIVSDAIKKLSDNYKNLEKYTNEIHKHLNEELDAIQYVLLINALDLNYSEYVRCNSIAGVIRFRNYKDINSRISIKTDHSPTVSPNDADFVFQYCVNAVLQIEERVGDIDAPLKQSP